VTDIGSNNGTNIGSNDDTCLKCVCPDYTANPDCTYERKNKNLAGGLQFLCFIGIGGVGNFVLERTGSAVGQFILSMSGYVLCIVACCGACVVAMCDNKVTQGILGGISGILGCVVSGAIFAGWLWSLIDGIFILQGKIDKDGNGYYIYEY
jgi:hypothetical protein